MPDFAPTQLTARADGSLHVDATGGQSPLRPGAQSRPFSKEPFIFRPDRLIALAEEVLSVIKDTSYTFAVRELKGETVDGQPFTPEAGAVAPKHFRRIALRANDWPLEGLVGQTGASNWKNMVNGSVMGKLKQIDQSQNNGRWILEKASADYDRRGINDTLYIDMVFVDLNNSEDLEWVDGAPRRSTKPTVQVIVQRETGEVEAKNAPQTGGGRSRSLRGA
jgi:hypothetical protein